MTAVAIRGDEVFVAGRFSVIGGALANNVARWDGHRWQGLGSGSDVGVDGRVNRIAVTATSVYVAGEFTRAGGAPARTLARWDGESWSSPGSELRSTPNGPVPSVDALAVDASTVYVGGTFAFAGEVSASNIVAFDETTGRWTPLGAGLRQSAGVGPTLVYSIVVTPESIYVGGRFGRAGRVKAHNVARWDRPRARWKRLGSGTDGTVRALAVDGATVYAGGWFGRAGWLPARGAAMWDGTAWRPLGDGFYAQIEGSYPAVQRLFFAAGRLVAAGTLRVTSDGDVTGLAEWDGTRWSPIGEPLSGLTAAGERVRCGLASAAIEGQRLAAVGWFDRVGDADSPSLAYFDLADGMWVPAYEQAPHFGVGSAVSCVSDGYVYVAGPGRYRAGVGLVTGVVRWDGERWESVTPPGKEIDGFVSAIAVANGRVYVGGLFGRAGDVLATNIAVWDGSEWSALGSGVGSGASEQILSMAVNGSDLYVGGLFTRAGDVPASNVARWDGATWHPLGDGVTGDVVAFAKAFAFKGGRVYVGGLFASAGEAPANNVAVWDGTRWAALGVGVAGSVDVLEVVESALIVGGEFDAAGGQPATSLARWSEVGEWEVPWLLTSGDDQSPQVSAIVALDTGLYVSGKFSSVDGVAARNVARLDASTWSALGSGLNGGATRVGGIGESVYLTGGFTAAGGRASVHIARWRP